MTGIEQFHLRLGIVPLERFCAHGHEDLVILAPDGERWGVVLAKVFLELGVQVKIFTVIVEYVQLYLSISRAID